MSSFLRISSYLPSLALRSHFDTIPISLPLLHHHALIFLIQKHAGWVDPSKRCFTWQAISFNVGSHYFGYFSHPKLFEFFQFTDWQVQSYFHIPKFYSYSRYLWHFFAANFGFQSSKHWLCSRNQWYLQVLAWVYCSSVWFSLKVLQ